MSQHSRSGLFGPFFSWQRALPTVWCTFCRLHLPKVLRAPQVFLTFEMQIELSLQSGAHCANLIFQKCSEHDSSFRHFQVQIELSLQSCALFVGNFARFDAHNHFHPWIHTLPNCYTSQLFDAGWLTCWCGWHDEMMWLPWWWKCWPWQSSVTRKLSS